jgi:hypothetical protein
MFYAVKRLHVPGFESRPGQDFSRISEIPHWLWFASILLFNCSWVCFSGVSWPRPDAGHLPPPRIKVNEWSHTSTPPINLRDVVRDSFALYTFISRGNCTASLLFYKWQPVDRVSGTVRVCCEEMTSCINTVWAKCRVF